LADIIYRPRSITEILDASFHLFRQHFQAFVTLTAVTYLPLAIFSLLFARYTGLSGDTAPTASPASLLILFPVQFIWFTVMSALVTTMTSRAYLDEPLEPGTIWRASFPRLLSVIATSFILVLVGGIGLIFLVFPGIYFYTRYASAPIVAVLEGVGVAAAFKRASTLSRDRKLHIFGVTFLAILMYLIVLAGVGMLALLMPSILLRSVMSFFGTIFTWAIIPIIQTVLYYDLRIRAEGYDVELMTRRLDQTLGSPAEAII
jgi:hypothetical protein